MATPARQNGRDLDSLKVLGLISVVVAPTAAEAQAKFADYKQCGLPEGALVLLSRWTGIDFPNLDLDSGVEEVEPDAIQSVIRQHGAHTVREWAKDLTVGGGAEVLIGSPESIGDQLMHWFEVSGVDGFNLREKVFGKAARLSDPHPGAGYRL